MKKLLLLSSALFLFGCENTFPEDMPVDQPNYDLLPVSQERKEETDVYSLDVEYQTFSGFTSKEAENTLNELIEDTIQTEIDEFISLAEEGFGELSEDIPSKQSSLFIRQENIFLSENFVSLKFEISPFSAGAAHPNHFTQTLNFDVKNSKLISLFDLFQPDFDVLSFVSTICQEDLTLQLEENVESAWIEDGAAPDEINFSSFVLEPAGITFYFDPYQVAPYALGTLDVFILYEEFREYINPKYADRM